MKPWWLWINNKEKSVTDKILKKVSYLYKYKKKISDSCTIWTKNINDFYIFTNKFVMPVKLQEKNSDILAFKENL